MPISSTVTGRVAMSLTSECVLGLSLYPQVKCIKSQEGKLLSVIFEQCFKCHTFLCVCISKFLISLHRKQRIEQDKRST